MKKLYRIKKSGKIAGLCAGLADLFEIDVTIVRLFIVFVVILTQVWPGVITYLAAWWLVPNKKPEAVSIHETSEEIKS